MQSQQLPTESQVLEDEVLPGKENADQPTEEMSEPHDHGRNHIGKVRIELCAKSFILQVRRFGEAQVLLANYFDSVLPVCWLASFRPSSRVVRFPPM